MNPLVWFFWNYIASPPALFAWGFSFCLIGLGISINGQAVHVGVGLFVLGLVLLIISLGSDWDC